MNFLTLLKYDTLKSVMERINQRWCFLEVTLLIKTYSDRLKDDILEKCHFYFA